MPRPGADNVPKFVKGEPVSARKLNALGDVVRRSLGAPGMFSTGAFTVFRPMGGSGDGSTTATVEAPGQYGVSEGEISTPLGVDPIYKILACPPEVDPGDLVGDGLYAPVYSLHGRPYNIGLADGVRVLLFGSLTWMDSETFAEWEASFSGTDGTDGTDGGIVPGYGLLINAQDYLDAMGSGHYLSNSPDPIGWRNFSTATIEGEASCVDGTITITFSPDTVIVAPSEGT